MNKIKLFIVTTLAVVAIFAAIIGLVAASHEEEIIILELSSRAGFNLQDIENEIKKADASSYEFRGVITIESQEITYGLFNGLEDSNTEFLSQIDEDIKGLISQNTNVESIPDSQFEQVKSTRRIKIFSFKDKESKIMRTKDMFTSKNIKHIDINIRKPF